jgi:quinol monooxygenase YgiN
MPYLLIRQKFADYTSWREAFDSLAEHRRAAGMRPLIVSRNAADPSEAVVVFEVDDPEAAQQHAASAELQEAHRRGGVIAGTNQVTVLVEPD